MPMYDFKCGKCSHTWEESLTLEELDRFNMCVENNMPRDINMPGYTENIIRVVCSKCGSLRVEKVFTATRTKHISWGQIHI